MELSRWADLAADLTVIRLGNLACSDSVSQGVAGSTFLVGIGLPVVGKDFIVVLLTVAVALLKAGVAVVDVVLPLKDSLTVAAVALMALASAVEL